MVRLKFMPDFLFCIDRSFEQAEHITTLLRDPRVARDLQHTDAADTGGDAETQNGRTAD
jgi:hypothetical protein